LYLFFYFDFSFSAPPLFLAQSSVFFMWPSALPTQQPNWEEVTRIIKKGTLLRRFINYLLLLFFITVMIYIIICVKRRKKTKRRRGEIKRNFEERKKRYFTASSNK
jgi:large-conductance mechanosensitive channel